VFERDFEPEAEPMREPSGRIPGSYVPPAEGFADSPWTLRPSSTSSARQAGSSLSVSVGAIPVSSLSAGKAATDGTAASAIAAGSASPPPAPAAPIPATAPLPAPTPLAAPTPLHLAAGPSAPITVPPAGTASVQAGSTPARKESTQALVAFGLVAAGAVIGIASLFLPWASVNGIGVGTTGSTPPPNQWGWGMPAGLLVFLLSGLVLGAVSGNDRAQERLPKLAPVIVKVSDLIMPMILGGIYLGVALLYLTLPWGCGSGILALVVGAVLLIAGAIVTLFFPSELATEAH
jgi:hypothetical protein